MVTLRNASVQVAAAVRGLPVSRRTDKSPKHGAVAVSVTATMVTTTRQVRETLVVAEEMRQAHAVPVHVKKQEMRSVVPTGPMVQRETARRDWFRNMPMGLRMVMTKVTARRARMVDTIADGVSEEWREYGMSEAKKGKQRCSRKAWARRWSRREKSLLRRNEMGTGFRPRVEEGKSF